MVSTGGRSATVKPSLACGCGPLTPAFGLLNHMTDNLQKPPEAMIGALLASGFPFQTAVAHAIRQLAAWSIVTEEYPWSDERGTDQFLDIVASYQQITATIECKKTEGQILTFLIPGGGRDDRAKARVLFLSQMQDSTHRFVMYCADWNIRPLSFESSFCVVSTSKSGKDQRLLERDAQVLIRGTDAFVQQRMRVKPETTTEPDRLYVPVLLTNAP